jgi:hypothetical protein
MVWWNSLEFAIATLAIFSFTWLECGNAADSMGMDNDAAVKFDGFVDDLRTAFICNSTGLKLVPCWSAVRSSENAIAPELASRASHAYALDFIAIGPDGREVCLSDAHPAWDFLSSCAGARGLALLTAEDRVWAEYSI